MFDLDFAKGVVENRAAKGMAKKRKAEDEDEGDEESDDDEDDDGLEFESAEKVGEWGLWCG